MFKLSTNNIHKSYNIGTKEEQVIFGLQEKVFSQ